jgi:hypothetical protein
MRYFLHLLPLAILLLAVEPACGQGDLAPQNGMVLLRNGNLLTGRVIRAGDYYIVATGQSSELRLPVQDVDAVCRDLDDAYAIKLATMTGKGARPHLDLADWCLRHQLIGKANEQLALAANEEPEHPRISGLQYRLKIANEKPREGTKREEKQVAMTTEQLDQWERELPKGTVDKFASLVQPTLMNRCATNGCHGGTSGGSYQLIRPPVGQLIHRRATQRNLFATIQQVDKSNPAESPLLQFPLKPHGGLPAPVFDRQSRIQLEQFAAWVEQATAYSPPVVVPSIAPAVAHLSQPSETAKPGANPEIKQLSATEPISEKPKPNSDKPAVPTAANFRPRDPFDPEIFNRKMQGKKTAGEK